MLCRSIRHRGEFEECAVLECQGATPPEEHGEPMTQEEWTAQAIDLARRVEVFAHLENLSPVRDAMRATAPRAEDPRVSEAARHLSYACYLMFLCGNEIETVAIPDFESWEQ